MIYVISSSFVNAQNYVVVLVRTANDYKPWPQFAFTGSLRPFPRSPPRTVPATIARPDYAEHPTGVSLDEQNDDDTIKVLNEEEVAGVRRACELAREVLDVAASVVRVGVTTDEIDHVVHEACIERKCYPSPLNYYGFPKSCCTSVNEVICHGIPDQRPLADGDIINIDVTVYHRGFHGDVNETLLVGNVDQNAVTLVRTTWECLQLATEVVAPGQPYSAIGDVIEKHANSHGFTVNSRYCGHGIHRLFHALPIVPHYAGQWVVCVFVR